MGEGEHILETNGQQLIAHTMVRGLSSSMDALVKLSKVQKFINWLECEVITKPEGERPSARKILNEFKRMTGVTPEPGAELY